MEVETSFGSWVRKRRRAMDMTQNELAHLAGCSVSALRKIEDDERRPSRQLAEILADRLDLPADQKNRFVQAARQERQTAQLGSPSDHLSTPLNAPSPTAGLPVPSTPLIGRETELAEIIHLLGSSPCRMLSLVGPGGIGKTRLAIEAAARFRDMLNSQAYYVSLVSLGSPELIIPAIAGAIGLPFYGSQEPLTQLTNALRQLEQDTLLVLDNFEHLLAGADLCAQILAAAPRIKLLVTTRERLLLQSEWVLEIQGLPVPPECSLDNADHFSSVVLFVACASRVRHEFKLSDQDCQPVARICQVVSGMPLGIELAASWVRTLSCQEIADEIELSLDFLTSSTRDIPQRHRSLRAVFDQSWKLLSPAERAVLSKLSVFRGGFQRDSGSKIAGANLALLTSLMDKSLVRRSDSGRYDLHELTSQYAATHLSENPQEEYEIRLLHCNTFMSFLEGHRMMLESGQQGQAMEEISAELGNIRSAVNWAIDHQCIEDYRMPLHTLRYFYSLREWHVDGLALYRKIVSAIRGSGRPMTQSHQLALGHALAAQGWFLTKSNLIDEAQGALIESLEWLLPTGDPIAIAAAYHWLGYLHFQIGDYDRARDYFLRCIQFDYPFSRGFALSTLGVIAQIQGDLGEASRLFREALALWRVSGDPRGLVFTLNQLGLVAYLAGQVGEAQSLLHESLHLGQESGDFLGLGTVMERLGMVDMLSGNYTEAADYFRQGIAVFTKIDNRFYAAQIQARLAEALIALGRRVEVRGLLMDALRMAYEVKAYSPVLDTLSVLACLQAMDGHDEQAIRLISIIRDHLAASQETRHRVQHLYEEIKTHLSLERVGELEAQQFETMDTMVNRLLSS